jgi:hypothetical protein
MKLMTFGTNFLAGKLLGCFLGFVLICSAAVNEVLVIFPKFSSVATKKLNCYVQRGSNYKQNRKFQIFSSNVPINNPSQGMQGLDYPTPSKYKIIK